MKRLLRILYIAATVLSFVLCLAAIALRSHLQTHWHRLFYTTACASEYMLEADARNIALTRWSSDHSQRHPGKWSYEHDDSEIPDDPPGNMIISIRDCCADWSSLGFHLAAHQYQDSASSIPRKCRGIAVPHWFLISVTAIGPLARVLYIFRPRRRPRPGFCPICGYDLRATPDRCPECGTLPPKLQSPA